jgi:hypothetical protein
VVPDVAARIGVTFGASSALDPPLVPPSPEPPFKAV